MDDCRLEPPMLRSLVRDRLPDEKRPFPSHSELVAVLSRVQSHGLLSECLSDSGDRKIAEAWKAAVDGWVDRIISLASSSMPDKCWAGSCFLGVTCEECCSDRFQSSYAIWFQKLLENIQSPSNTHFIKVACFASLIDLFTRLACFPNLKKDGTLFARKIINPVLQMLNEEAEESSMEVGVNLLYTLIFFFPSCLQQHYDNIEAVLASNIMEAKWNVNISKKISCCLAMLPKVKANEDSWCLIIQKILIAINSIITDAFQGFEEEKKCAEVMKMLVPPGKDPPPPLGGRTLLGEGSEPAIRRLSELLVPRVSTLMHSCCIMITKPYSFSVSIPVSSLLATIERVLQVDGSFRESSLSFATSMHQELLCAEIPALHLASLHLLIAIIKGLRSKLLPHGANIVRLIIEYFRRVRIPSIRRVLYSIVQMLVTSYGVAMTLQLAQEVISNAFVDLTDNLELENTTEPSSNTQYSIPFREIFQQNQHRKRKRASQLPAEYPNGVDFSIKPFIKKPQSPLSVKIAALKALEALLSTGGSFRSEGWRPDVDSLLVTVAKNACERGWNCEDELFLLANEPFLADFQIAALEALLTSLLSPSQTRPPYLSQGVDLFRRGMRETGSKIASFCAHALLSLEFLVHPRAPSLADLPCPKNPSHNEGFSSKFASSAFNTAIKLSSSPSFKSDRAILDEDEESPIFCHDKSEERTFSDSRNPIDKCDKSTKQSSNSSEVFTAKVLTIGRNPIDKCDETTKQSLNASKDFTTNPSNINAEVAHHSLECENNTLENVDKETDEDSMGRDKVTSAICASEVPPCKIGSSLGSSANLGNHGGSEEDHTRKNLLHGLHKAKDAIHDLYKGEAAMFSYDFDSDSQDSMPDIVVGDPDSE